MTKRMTAKALRKMIPPQDLNDKAFREGDSLGLSLVGLASSVDGLRRELGEYGEAAVLSAEWDAIFDWLRRDEPEGLCEDVKIVRDALTLWREYVLHSVGLSRGNGLHLPILQRISEPSQEEAERIAAHTVKLWTDAGRPRLTGNCIRWAHQMFLHRVRLRQAHDRRVAMGLPA